MDYIATLLIMKAVEHDARLICDKLVEGIQDNLLKGILEASIKAYYTTNEGKPKKQGSSVAALLMDGQTESAAELAL